MTTENDPMGQRIDILRDFIAQQTIIFQKYPERRRLYGVSESDLSECANALVSMISQLTDIVIILEHKINEKT